MYHSPPTGQRRRFGNSAILRDERGITTVEYVIILVLVAIGSIGTWQVFGGKISGKVGEAGQRILTMENPDPGGQFASPQTPSQSNSQNAAVSNANSNTQGNSNVTQTPSPNLPTPSPKGAKKVVID
jgi:Flp pilus assembly pilin Flp